MLLLITLLLTTTTTTHSHHLRPAVPPIATKQPPPENQTEDSKQLCWQCTGEPAQFLYGHNLVRARKMEPPLAWDPQLERYAKWWAGQRRADCALEHSFPDGDFKLGENIYWGGGASWTPADAVRAWADEEKYYDYRSNSCVGGEMCGHYTQIVWRATRRVGCARVVCDSGDVFMTCNYYPPGNYIGERPY
ncbi:pathogenesis-related protein PR-1-like [Andrographis paniculata]|uniref:pathogenesis-related protein PR-1-like n=1 Tax=Andrographis paniculata TaxID=175694 RepID=UPI0021E959DB|nr:pathogenesis-related protein PR-1-like [Andrographis paniculata]